MISIYANSTETTCYNRNASQSIVSRLGGKSKSTCCLKVIREREQMIVFVLTKNQSIELY